MGLIIIFFMSTKPATRTKKTPDPKALTQKLLDFYWQILKDTNLKPSDRIASAKRLEALLSENSEEEGAAVYVTLNLPPGNASPAGKTRKCPK